MSQNVPSSLSKKQAQAAQLVADDRLSDEQIAQQCGINRRTLTRWKDEEVFKVRVAEIQSAYATRALSQGLARRDRRLMELDDIYTRLRGVIQARSEAPELATVPGGKTGLVTRMVKGIGRGDDYRIVEVYEVDTGTTKELRAILDQVAEETGQKVRKVEGKFDVESMSKEQRAARLAELLQKAGVNGLEPLNSFRN